MDMTAPDAGQGRLRVSQIAYYCDLTDASGSVIPLGVIADIRVGVAYGLGLKARKILSEHEALKIGGLARELMRRPFDMLLREFDAIWDGADPETDFPCLPDKHPGSLRFETIETSILHIPALLELRANRAPDILSQWVEDKLIGGCDIQFWKLLEKHLPENTAQADRKLREKRVA